MPCDFSLAHYEEILQQIKGRAGTVAESKDIILTHDIDIFPAYALRMAQLEHSYGVKATYYVLLHSEWYNALSPENMQIWKQIRELGHEIALHYDGNFDKELGIIHAAFCELLQTTSINISQHLVGITPNLEMPSDLQDRSTIIKNKGYHYIADSGGWWRNGCICQHLDKSKILFVCHPVWWVQGKDPWILIERDSYAVIRRSSIFWENMVNEHRKQQKQTVQVTARST